MVARTAGTGTPGTTTVRVQPSPGAVLAAHADSRHARARCRVMAVIFNVYATAPIAVVAVAKTEGTTTSTHAMSAVTTLGVAVGVVAHGIASDTIMGWRDRCAMSPRTLAGAAAVAAGDRVRHETAPSSTGRLPKAGRRASSAPCLRLSLASSFVHLNKFDTIGQMHTIRQTQRPSVLTEGIESW